MRTCEDRSVRLGAVETVMFAVRAGIIVPVIVPRVP